MIKIHFENIYFENGLCIKNENRLCKIITQGHSFMGKKGADILCSAVSVLSQTFVLSVGRLVSFKQNIYKDDGYLESSFKCNSLDVEDMIKIETLLNFFYIGLIELKKNYPKKIDIIFE